MRHSKARKLMIAITLSAIIFSLCGCNSAKLEEEYEDNVKSMFILVEKIDCRWLVVYHRETKVMYAISNGGYNTGSFTVLLNPDGSPMLWEVNDG